MHRQVCIYVIVGQMRWTVKGLKALAANSQGPPTFPPRTMQTRNLIKRSPGLYRCGAIGDDHPRVDHESVESSPNWFAYRLIERAACRSDRTKSNETNRDPWRSRLVVDLDVALKVTSSNAFVASTERRDAGRVRRTRAWRSPKTSATHWPAEWTETMKRWTRRDETRAA